MIRPKSISQVEPEIENRESLSSASVTDGDVVIEDETVVEDETGSEVQNDFNEDAPTYEEALKMQTITQNEIRRRISSQRSLKNDDLPDYDSIDSSGFSG